ncbi:MAG: phage portal protein [Chloroflexi bacterium]|nr:MAG: phage portal protein [Chloroflexota bacterium]
MANDAYSASFYASGGHIQYALEAPQEFSPKAKAAWRKEWRRLFSGIKKAFKDIPIIDRGAKLHQLKLNARDAALVEGKKAFVQDAGRMFDVPGHMIGAGDNYTFASVEVMVTDFVMYSIRNTVKQIEAELNRKLFSEEERGRYFVKFNIDSLLRGDTETRTKKIETELKWGIITRNEARQLSGYNKIDGLDEFLVPLNMQTNEI